MHLIQLSSAIATAVQVLSLLHGTAALFQFATIRPFAVDSIIDDRLPDNGAEVWLSDHLTWFPCSILPLEPQVERSNYRLSVLFVVIQLIYQIMPNLVIVRTLYETRER